MKHIKAYPEGKTTSKLLKLGAVSAVLVSSLIAPAAHAGLIIAATWGSSLSGFGANEQAVKDAFAYAALQFTSRYSDNVTINIDVQGNAGTSILGQSSTPLGSIAYGGLVAAVKGDAKSADDLLSVSAAGSVTAADPAAGNSQWWLTRAQAKALGIIASDSVNDGTVTFGEGFTYAFDPANRAVAGSIDLVGVMMHEISEVMGRQGLSGAAFPQSIGGPPGYTLLDDFSYSGVGAKGLGGGSGNAFSIDAGTTQLLAFNGVAGGDTRDWASGSDDSFNAFSSSGVQNNFSATDIREMDVIGWDLIGQGGSVPEPPTLALMGAVLVGMGLRRRKA
jgi:hypothetical protein